MWGWFLILPSVFFLGVWEIGPTFLTFYYTFTKWGAFSGHAWIGLGNYAELVKDPQVRGALLHTFLYTFVGVVTIPGAVVTAALLNKRGLRGLGFYRTLYFLPVVTISPAIALMWRFLFNNSYGPINAVIREFGIQGPIWLSQTNTAIWALVIVMVWGSLGYNIVLLLAGMQNVPVQLYEAAEIDGAGRIRQFWSVTVPMVSPTIFFVTVISVITSFQTFDLVYLMTSVGAPSRHATESVVSLFYTDGFVNGDGGYAASIGFVLFLIIALVTAIQFKLQKRWVST